MRTDSTDITCSHHKFAPMKHYISNLRKVSQETLPKPKQSENRAEWEPLEVQIKRWWANLPPVMQQRPYQITEIAAQCRGRYRDKPAVREVAVALRVLGWSERRDWSVSGRNRRLWIPASTECRIQNAENNK